MKSLSNFRGILYGLLLVGAAVGCGGDREQRQAARDEAAKVVVVGTNPEYPPMQFIDPETGEIIGYEIELMEAIAEKAGFEMRWSAVEWKGIFGALEAGDIDAIMSAATITPERQQKYNFSDPYYTISQRLVVRKQDADAVSSIEELNARRIGVQLNTTGAIMVEKEYPGFVRITYDNTPLAFADLESGSIFGFMVDEPVAEQYARANPRKAELFQALPFKFSEEHYGVVLRKGDTELLEKINKGLEAVREAGIDRDLQEKWFE